MPPFCPKTGEDRAALQAFEDEVIERLYVLNADRAREEQRLGLTGKKGKGKRAAKKDKAVSRKAAKSSDSQTAGDAEQGELF